MKQFQLLWFTPLIALLAMLSANSQAHLLKVFAHTQVAAEQQLAIKGKVYFAGGAGVSNLSIEIFDQSGAKYSKITSNAEGDFSTLLANGDYLIVANTLDGHIAKWKITAFKKTTFSPKNITSKRNTVTDTLKLRTEDNALFEELIAKQLQQQIQPLAEQINSLQDKARFQDILGAIGYIFGIFGLAIWWRQKGTNT